MHNNMRKKEEGGVVGICNVLRTKAGHVMDQEIEF